jgi:chromosome segregation ATPase
VDFLSDKPIEIELEGELRASEVKQLERQLVAQAASHSRLHAGLSQARLDTRNLAQEQQRLQRELRESAAQTERLGQGGKVLAGP